MPNADQIMDALAELLAPKVAELLNSVAPGTDESYSDEPVDDAPADDDPWGAPEPATRAKPRASRTASRGGNRASSRPTSNRGGGNRGGGNRSFPSSGEHEDRNGKLWTFGLDDAPECEHGVRAAEVVGQAKNGRDYRAWACPYGFGKDYREKCDLFDFIND